MKKEKQEKIPAYYPDMTWPLGQHFPFDIDPLGSYTGVPEDALEQPVQDADDL